MQRKVKQTKSKLAGHGVLRVHVVKAVNLMAADLNGKSDPYVVVRAGGVAKQTAAIHANLNPDFDEVVEVPGTLSTFIATGLGAHMALPLLRQEWTAEMGEAEARALLTKCMQVLFYRDTRACSTIQIGKVDASGASISAPTKLDTYWEHPEFIKGGGHRGDGSW